VNEEEVAKYEGLLEEALWRRGRGSDAATTTTLGAENPSSAVVKLISACVIGMSALMGILMVNWVLCQCHLVI